MSKPLPLTDFRAVRIVLEPDDFALGSESPEPSPSDLISEESWRSLVTLPDDVAVRTSNHYGTTVKDISELRGELVSLSIALQQIVKDVSRSPMAHVMIDATDEL